MVNEQCPGMNASATQFQISLIPPKQKTVAHCDAHGKRSRGDGTGPAACNCTRGRSVIRTPGRGPPGDGCGPDGPGGPAFPSGPPRCVPPVPGRVPRGSRPPPRAKGTAPASASSRSAADSPVRCPRARPGARPRAGSAIRAATRARPAFPVTVRSDPRPRRSARRCAESQRARTGGAVPEGPGAAFVNGLTEGPGGTAGRGPAPGGRGPGRGTRAAAGSGTGRRGKAVRTPPGDGGGTRRQRYRPASPCGTPPRATAAAPGAPGPPPGESVRRPVPAAAPTGGPGPRPAPGAAR